MKKYFFAVGILAIVMLAGCGSPLRTDSATTSIPQLNIAKLDFSDSSLGGSGGNTAVRSSEQQAIFSQPNAALGGKTPLELFTASFGENVNPSTLAERMILAPGKWRLRNKALNATQYRVLFNDNSPIRLEVGPVGCSESVMGSMPIGGEFTLCLDIPSQSNPYASFIRVDVMGLNGQVSTKILQVLVVPEANQFNNVPASCQLSLSANSVTLGQTVTVELRANGPVAIAKIDGFQVSLPFVSRPLSLVKEASSLGSRRLRAELFTSASSTTPAAFCEANLTVNASQMVGNCSSINRSRNECSFPQVKEFVAIKSFVKISDAPCQEGSSFGLTPDKRKIWVDDGCRADFTFSYIPN